VDTTLRESSFVSLAHGPRWLFLLSRHRKAASAAANQMLFCKNTFVHQDICETNYQVVRAKRLASAWQQSQAVLIGS